MTHRHCAAIYQGTVTRIEDDLAVVTLNCDDGRQSRGAACPCCNPGSARQFTMPMLAGLREGQKIEVELHTPSGWVRGLYLCVLPLAGILIGIGVANLGHTPGDSIAGSLLGAVVGLIGGFLPTIVTEQLQPNLLWPWITPVTAPDDAGTEAPATP